MERHADHIRYGDVFLTFQVEQQNPQQPGQRCLLVGVEGGEQPSLVLEMGGEELLAQLQALGREADRCAAPVRRIGAPLDEPSFGECVDADAVVPDVRSSSSDSWR